MVLGIVLFSITAVSAQNTLPGKVVDSKGKPIPGARVTAINKTTGNGAVAPGYVSYASTDVNGEFKLTSPFLISRVKVEYAGYRKKTATARTNMIVRMHKAYKETVSITFQLSMPNETFSEPAYGGMISWCRGAGLYFRGVGSAVPEYYFDNAFIQNPDRYTYTGERRSAYMSMTGGLMIRLCSVLNIYAGAGYAQRIVAYEVKDPNVPARSPEFCKHPTHSYQSVAVDCGLVLKLRPIAFTAGCTYVPNHGFVGNYGVGFCF